MTVARPIMYHIPVCPFSQRLEILLDLKGMRDAVRFEVVDITTPRDPELLKKTRGTTALPVMELPDGEILKESLVLLRYIDETMGEPVRRADPYEHAVENLVSAKESELVVAGYTLVMNQDESQREAKLEKLLKVYRDLNTLLDQYNPDGTFLFEEFGWAECVYTSMFMRFWFLDYYEGFELPQTKDYARVAKWKAACLAHPAAQQVSFEEIVTLYFDYALGYGNGALPEGRERSSFVFEPDWRDRPMPPKEKYTARPSDAALGLV